MRCPINDSNDQNMIADIKKTPLPKYAEKSERIPRVAIAICGLIHGYCWLQLPGIMTATVAWITWTLIIGLGTAHSAKSSGIRWFVAGMGGRVVAFNWIPGVVAENYEIAYPLGCLLLVLMIAFESLTWFIIGIASFHVFRRRTLSVWVVPSLVIILDHYWPHVFPSTMAHTLIGFNTLIQIVDLGGALGLTWLITAISCVVVRIVDDYYRRTDRERFVDNVKPQHSGFMFTVTVLILFALSLGYGAYQQSNWTFLADPTQDVRVAAIQVDTTWVRCEERLCELSRTIVPAPDLVIWPESSLGVYSDKLDQFKNEDYVYARSREPHCSLPGYTVAGTTLLGCGVTFTDDAPLEGPYRNTSLLIDDKQRIIGKYVKRSLLPFGEYVPGQSMLPALRHFANIDRVRECGNDSQPMITNKGLKIGAMICYDDINPAIARETVAQGAQLLTVQVNAADYDDPVALRQHCLLARLRAVENRRYFIRCASTGVTCIISPVGAVEAECEPQTEAIVTGTIRPFSKKTIFSRFGDIPVYVSLGLIAFSLLKFSAADRSSQAVGR